MSPARLAILSCDSVCLTLQRVAASARHTRTPHATNAATHRKLSDAKISKGCPVDSRPSWMRRHNKISQTCAQVSLASPQDQQIQGAQLLGKQQFGLLLLDRFQVGAEIGRERLDLGGNVRCRGSRGGASVHVLRIGRRGGNVPSALATDANGCSSSLLTVANTHAVLARSCALNSLIRCFAALTKTLKSFPSR